MISLISELTDAKGRSASRGWVFFDAECSFCSAWARRMRRTLESRGFGLAPLQSPRVRALLNIPEEGLLREMRLLTADGTVLGGADVLLHLARNIWWAWPVFALAHLPGVRRLLASAYRSFARNRNCIAGTGKMRRGPALPRGLEQQ
jgi:predicted DCC family thiol-disulfide oxidoreductase YuxK